MRLSIEWMLAEVSGSKGAGWINLFGRVLQNRFLLIVSFIINYFCLCFCYNYVYLFWHQLSFDSTWYLLLNQMITNSVVQLFDVAVVSLVSLTEFEFRFVSLVSGLMFSWKFCQIAVLMTAAHLVDWICKCVGFCTAWIGVGKLSTESVLGGWELEYWERARAR